MGLVDDFPLSSPLDVARFFVYVSSYKNKGKTVNFKNIQAKTFYTKANKIFDKFFDEFTKRKLDMKKYIYFFINSLGKTRKDVPQDFLSCATLSRYVEDLKIEEQYEKIFKYFMKSVENIAHDCLENDYDDAGQYLSSLIFNNKLGEQYISGKISQYYLATIKNIGKLISSMDSINRDELKTITERSEKLCNDTQNAFLYLKSQKINPITITNKAIQKIKQKKEK